MCRTPNARGLWGLTTIFSGRSTAGSDDGQAVRDALAELDIQGAFPGGPDIILPYDRIKFENHGFDGVWYWNNNTCASVAIAQIQGGEYRTGYCSQAMS